MYAVQQSTKKQTASSKSSCTSPYMVDKKKEKHSGAISERQHHARKHLSSSQPHLSSTSTAEKMKETKSLRSVQKRDLKLPPSKPPSNPNLAPRDPAAELRRELNKYQNENAYMMGLTDKNKKILQGDRNKAHKLARIRTNHQIICNLTTRLHNKQACKTHIKKNQQAKEDKLQNAKETIYHMNQLSQDKNLWRLDDLNCILTQVANELEDKDRRIKDLKEQIAWEEYCFNRQLNTEWRKLYNI